MIPTTVDIVITWVDGSDPQWRLKRAEYSHIKHTGLSSIESENVITATADVEGRYRCNQELRFLLRSIQKYWPFAGYIYLVTDQQTPRFIVDHPRLILIDHQEIIPAENLPVFSSRAIESHLHRIPGLAEHYVVFNDDLFLTRPVVFEDFFGVKGEGRVHRSNQPLASCAKQAELSGCRDAISAADWISHRYGRIYLNELVEHAPRGILKSRMQALEALDPVLFKVIGRERFRTLGGQSIVSNLYGHWCLAEGWADEVQDVCVYIESHQLETIQDITALFASCAGKLCLCINDTTDDRHDIDEVQKKALTLLTLLFPKASDYEKLQFE